MKRILALTINYSFIIFLLSTTTCSDSEPHMGSLGKTSMVIINLGLPDKTASADRTVMDRILRFFSPRYAMAQKAPAAFSTINVRITGDDIGVIEKEFSPYGSISLNVPSGSQRQFQVTAYVAPNDPSAAASFRGTALSNLPAGETITIPIAMKMHETKIIIPDYYRRRIVILNSMNGSGWTVRTGLDIGFGADIYPYDIDFDDRGRIYILHNLGVGTTSRIIRIDDLNGKNMISFTLTDGFTTPLGNALALAIDSNNDRIYVANATRLDIATLDGIIIDSSSPITFLSGIGRYSGIDVAPNGTLYFAGQDTGLNDAVISYNPSTGAHTSQQVEASSTAFDVVVKNPNVYVTQKMTSASAGISAVRRYTLDLGPGYQELRRNSLNISDTLRGPERFIAIKNEAIFFIDANEFDGPAYDYLERIIGIADIEGDSWLSFTPNPSADQSFFGFYNAN